VYPFRACKHSQSTGCIRVLARILDLGRVSNDQGVFLMTRACTCMSITLNSKIIVLVMLANNNACGCSMLCNQIQGEHTLILRTEVISATLGGI
jgi:hypothetical protein